MTIKLFPFAAGCVGALALMGAAIAAPIDSANTSDDVTGSIATPAADHDSPFHVYCFNGAARDGTTQHRGWVCQQETGAQNSGK